MTKTLPWMESIELFRVFFTEHFWLMLLLLLSDRKVSLPVSLALELPFPSLCFKVRAVQPLNESTVDVGEVGLNAGSPQLDGKLRRAPLNVYTHEDTTYRILTAVERAGSIETRIWSPIFYSILHLLLKKGSFWMTLS